MALEIKENEPLANHSTFRIGGPARYFAMVKNQEELLEAIKYAEEKNLKYIVIGGGSNILFKDEGFEGLVIKARSTNIEIRNENTIFAEAGVLLSQVVMKAAELGLSGLEWAVGIPGTIGGGIVGNCGAYGKSLSDNLKSITIFDPETKEIKNIKKEDCGFNYRESKFKNFKDKSVILKAEFELQKKDPEEIKKEMKEIIAQRVGHVPAGSSAGSVFLNIKHQAPNSKQIQNTKYKIPNEAIKGGKISVGYLIGQCGLKGRQAGGAQISPLHANFIINTGKATAKDVLALMELCKKEVLGKFGILLESEIVVI